MIVGSTFYPHFQNSIRPVVQSSDEELQSQIVALYPSRACYHFNQPAYDQQLQTLCDLYKSLIKSQFSFFYAKGPCDAIDAFCKAFLQKDNLSKYYEHRRTNDVEYFKSVKKLLEEIYVLLQERAKTSKSETQSCLMNLIKGFDVCAPGLLGHLEELKIRLRTQNSLDYWLAEIRTRNAESYADIHFVQKGIHAGNHVHVWMAFIKHANQQGYNLLKKTHKDSFESLAKITYRDLLNFRAYNQKEYNQKAIVECAEHNFRALLCEFVDKYAPKEEEQQSFFSNFFQAKKAFAWVSSWVYQQEQAVKKRDLGIWLDIPEGLYANISKDATLLLNALFPSKQEDECDISCLLEFNDEYDKVRIKPEIVNDLEAYILQALLDEGVLTGNRADNLFATGRMMPENPIKQVISNLDQRLRNSIAAGLITFASWLSVGSLIARRILFSQSLLLGVCVGFLYQSLDKIKEHLQQESYRRLKLSDGAIPITEPEKVAFDLGTKAQQNTQAYINSFTTWQSYAHYASYLAGREAQKINDAELKQRMQRRLPV